jgi:uncharacterized OB-fold protein
MIPLPVPDDDTKPFWDGCKRHELLLQRCASCGRLRFTPRHLCPACRSDACEWVPASGRGTIYSMVVCHPTVLPAFADRAPYAVVLVELEEDPSLRLVGNVLDASPETLEIGMPVRVDFQDLNEEIALPQWRLVEETPDE